MASSTAGDSGLLLGCGIYDITGPAAERGMMGYASPFQKTGGIHMRLRSRAFVIESADRSARLAFVSADLCMISQAVKLEVVARLKERLGERFSTENVMLSATHTHAGPGGYFHHTLYNLTTAGFDRQNFEAIVTGVVESIVRAQGNLAPGRIKIATGELKGIAKNRSPKAYALNPAEERARYDSDTDDSMVVLRLEREDGSEIGMISWFAIHGTSLDNDNKLTSGDNKGYASYLFEQLMSPDGVPVPSFVAAFAQSNEGDISPNVYGGEGGRGSDQFESMTVSGSRQCEAARALYDQATEALPGRVGVRHAYVGMSKVAVEPRWSGSPDNVTTCSAAIGVSMLAGTEDGRGIGWEGVSKNAIRRLLGRLAKGLLIMWVVKPWRLRMLAAWGRLIRKKPAEDCQGQKISVIPTGKFRPPWTPQVLPLQVAQIGSLGIAAVPFECTTMAGRRLKETVLSQLRPAGVTRVVIAGLANSYAGYVATREEYDRQDYEGASTHFGPWTLAAVQQTVAHLASSLAAGHKVDSDIEPSPPPDTLLDLQTAVLLDASPPGKALGGVRKDALPSYQRGQKVVVSFWAGHPKNDFRTEGTFLNVQRREVDRWLDVANDHDPETRFIWRRWPLFCLPYSTATVEWRIPANIVPGTYRVSIYGEGKRLFGPLRSYAGTSREFRVS